VGIRVGQLVLSLGHPPGCTLMGVVDDWGSGSRRDLFVLRISGVGQNEKLGLVRGGSLAESACAGDLDLGAKVAGQRLSLVQSEMKGRVREREKPTKPAEGRETICGAGGAHLGGSRIEGKRAWGEVATEHAASPLFARGGEGMGGCGRTGWGGGPRGVPRQNHKRRPNMGMKSGKKKR